MSALAAALARTRYLWLGLPYRRRGFCVTCRTFTDIGGRNTASLVCFECFDVDHNGHAPNYRRRRSAA